MSSLTPGILAMDAIIQRSFMPLNAMPPTRKLRVYIAGPMRFRDHHNFPEFFKAAAMLDLWGYEAVNPAQLDMREGRSEWNWSLGTIILDNSFTMENALARDFDEIRTCKAILLLQGWDQSEGASREVALALSRGIPCFLYDESKPLNLEDAVPLDIMVKVSCILAEPCCKERDK